MKSEAPMELIAHVRKLDSGEWDKPHLLSEHLQGVAKLAEQFATHFNAEKLATIVGLCHDIGKGSAAFQQKIRMASGYEANQYKGQSIPAAPHSDAGAQYMTELYGALGKSLAYCIAGHHGGMPNGLDSTDACLEKRLSRTVSPFESLDHSLQQQLPVALQPGDVVVRDGMNGFSISFLIRMLFSCLVDADYLDTEAYMSPRNAEKRVNRYDFVPLLNNLDSHIQEISKSKKDSPISSARQRILNDCRKAASCKPGLFSLTVPTGGGKTLSSMAFALSHSVQFEKERIIYAIPFTSIIEQNAAVFRKALGNHAILEHHSGVDPEDVSFKNKLAAENWDAPVVVTTNVQLFESLFASKTSKCRKLHNIANSVIIIDEAQMLSPDYLMPTLEALKELVNGYGCTVVLCTATQPALLKTDDFADGLENVREIIKNPRQLYEQFRRVAVEVAAGRFSILDISERIREHRQVLCIVNRRKDAMEIYQALGGSDSNFHLSTFMCAEHRSSTLQLIRERLARGEECRVVSTQLIEAGVDVDFPFVYRAEAGIDSIAQAAGRCNREGKMTNGGKVIVFQLETRPPVGLLRQSADEGQKIIRTHHDDVLSLDAVTDYFKAFYWKRRSANGLDKKDIIKQLASGAAGQSINIPFRDVSRVYCLIENTTTSVIVPWDAGEQMAHDLAESGVADRLVLRKLQRYVVQVRKEIRDELILAGCIQDIFGDGTLFRLTNKNIYDDKIGLNTEQSLLYETAALFV